MTSLGRSKLSLTSADIKWQLNENDVRVVRWVKSPRCSVFDPLYPKPGLKPHSGMVSDGNDAVRRLVIVRNIVISNCTQVFK